MKALIIGITGQDGSYLAELLLSKGYEVHGIVRVKVSSKYYRPSEVDYLLGNSDKARSVLGWKPVVSFDELVKRMIDSDLKELA